MKFTIRALLLVFIVTFSHVSYAKTLSSLDQTKNLSDKATAFFGKNNIKDGFLTFKAYWPIPDSEIDTMINQTQMQWSMIPTRFGQPVDIEYIRKETIGDTFIKYIYLQKFENHAIRWMITFYKPKDKWKVNSVTWDDKIQLLFQND